MKALRALVLTSAIVLGGVVAVAPASADPVPAVPVAATGSSEGVIGLFAAPFIIACWMLTHTGSDIPSPQCDAIFQPLIRQFVAAPRQPARRPQS
jgi:hypothetical protein